MEYQKYSSVPWTNILQNVICNYAGLVVAAEQTSGTTPPLLSGYFNLGCFINNIITNVSYKNFGSVAVPNWVEVGTVNGTSSVYTDGVTIGGNGTPASPVTSLLSTYGPIAITGTVNGTNLVFTIPSGVVASSLQIYVGTQYQIQGVNYNVSGTTVTFTSGNAPSVQLTAFGATAAVAAPSAFMYTTIASSYAAAQALAVGTTPFLVFVQSSSQFNNAPTLYIYDGINTGHLNQIASLLI